VSKEGGTKRKKSHTKHKASPSDATKILSLKDDRLFGILALMKIQDRNGATVRFRWKDLQWLQHPDLKDFSKTDADALEYAVRKYGLIRGLNAWHDEENDTMYCLDGNHLRMILLKLEAEGVEIPDEIDVHLKLCHGIKEAAEFVLLYSSVYARVNYDGLQQHLHQFDIQPMEIAESVEMPFIDVKGYFGDSIPEDKGPDEPGTLDADALARYRTKPQKISFAFNSIERGLYFEALNRIKKKYDLKNLTQVLKHLINLEIDVDPDEDATAEMV
jgi:hypothetical protein